MCTGPAQGATTVKHTAVTCTLPPMHPATKPSASCRPLAATSICHGVHVAMCPCRSAPSYTMSCAAPFLPHPCCPVLPPPILPYPCHDADTPVLHNAVSCSATCHSLTCPGRFNHSTACLRPFYTMPVLTSCHCEMCLCRSVPSTPCRVPMTPTTATALTCSSGARRSSAGHRGYTTQSYSQVRQEGTYSVRVVVLCCGVLCFDVLSSNPQLTTSGLTPGSRPMLGSNLKHCFQIMASNCYCCCSTSSACCIALAPRPHSRTLATLGAPPPPRAAPRPP